MFKANHSQQVTKDLYIKAANICIEASSNITIKVGQSHIAIDNSGVKIGTSGDIELDAKMNIKQKGGIAFEAKGVATAKLESVKVDVKGSAMVGVQGAIVKIN